MAGFDAASGIATTGLRAPKDVLFFSDLAYDLTQWAVFSEATLNVTPRFDITAGLRYYDFNEDREQAIRHVSEAIDCDPDLADDIGGDEDFASVRDDVRFVKLVR